MNSAWFERVSAETALTQGDLIDDCPVIGWKDQQVSNAGSDTVQRLNAAIETLSAEVIVMTQACDLEQRNVESVILCPCYVLADYRPYWDARRRALGKKSTNDAFASFCQSVRNGFVWNLTLLNHSGTQDKPNTDHRIVDFHNVYTSPRSFLESILTSRQTQRLRLLSPYREHLSQSFARFFMRVGLPVAVSDLPAIP